jgi:hypothetical protein
MALYQKVLSSYQAAATSVLEKRAARAARLLEHDETALRKAAPSAAAVSSVQQTEPNMAGTESGSVFCGHRSNVKAGGSRVDTIAWDRFASLRKKEQIELGCRYL